MTLQTTIETRKRHYYHKGDHTLVCYEDEVPEGYTPGPSDAWKKKRNDTFMERYGVRSPSQLEEVKNKLKEKAPAAKKKREQTLIEKYGVDNAMKADCIKQKMSHIISSKEVQEKTRRTCRERYGEDDVLREYTDFRYPFKYDFYIKSKDLFIELNLHPSHGEHPFDPESIEDQRLVEELRSKGDTWSNMIVDVWTERDYNKIKFMKDNNLNYMLIYPKDYYRKED